MTVAWLVSIIVCITVCKKYLETNEEERDRLYEVEAPGEWTQRRNVWLNIQLQKLQQDCQDSACESLGFYFIRLLELFLLYKIETSCLYCRVQNSFSLCWCWQNVYCFVFLQVEMQSRVHTPSVMKEGNLIREKRWDKMCYLLLI